MKNTLKLILAFVLGITLTSSTIYAARTIFLSEELSFDNSNTGLFSTNVKGALDELYSLNDNDKLWLLKYKELTGKPINYDYENAPTTDSPTTPPEGKPIYLALFEDGNIGTCIKKEEKEYCFEPLNYDIEKEIAKEIFGDACNEHYIEEPDLLLTSCSSNNFSIQINASGSISVRYGSSSCGSNPAYGIYSCGTLN